MLVTIDDKEYEVVNEESYKENFWGKNWLVTFASIFTPMVVNASCEQDALDIFADHAQTQKWYGLFLDESETDEYEFIRLGNEGWPVPSDEIYLEQID